MTEIDRIGTEMCRNIFDFLLPLQTTKEIKANEFQKVEQSSRKLAQLLKGSDTIPRMPFKELYSAARVLQAEAEYSKNPEVLLEMASKLHMTADLIVWGECHEDRKPGIPRVR